MAEKIEGLNITIGNRRNLYNEEIDTLKVVLKAVRKNPTPQMVEAAAKLVEAIKS